VLGKFKPAISRLRGVFAGTQDRSLEAIEDTLIRADVGVKYSAAIVKTLEQTRGDRAAALREELIRLLSLECPEPDGTRPMIIMVSGVNGSGKTTSVAKLANLHRKRGSVLLASADTYRDAAHEQLSVWAEKVGVEVVGSQKGQDAGAVVFDAIAKAKAKGIECVIIDTAGRLHTRADLMEELKKILRIVRKFKVQGPDYNILTIDATLGQNSIQQARIFAENIGVNGLMLTKFDGTAKGGAIIPICNELKLPVLYLGVGEGVNDILEFDPKRFVAALFD
jgi:fused signal recognition particle receptor